MSTTKDCRQLLDRLQDELDKAGKGHGVYRALDMVEMGCHEVVPYLLQYLKADDPFLRKRALSGLKRLEGRRHRQAFVDVHFRDPDETVRQMALVQLSAAFHGERDPEILALALQDFDAPSSSVALRLAAGAAMMFQFDINDPTGPGWWNGEEEDLNHPAILRAVAETREMLRQKPAGESAR